MKHGRWIGAALAAAVISPAVAFAASPAPSAGKFPVPTRTTVAPGTITSSPPSTTTAAPVTTTVVPTTTSAPSTTTATTTSTTTTATPPAVKVPKPAFVRVPGEPFAAGAGATDVAFSPNGELLAVADFQINAVSMFRVAANGRLSKVTGSPFPAGSGPISLSFAADGKTLAVGDYTTSTITLEAISPTGRLTPRAGSPIPVAGPPYGIRYSRDGRLLAVADWTGDELQLFTNNAKTGLPGAPVVTEALPAGSDPSSVAFSPNSQLLVVAEHDANAVAGYSVSTKAPLTLTPLPGSPLTIGSAADTVSFNREGTLVAAANYNADQVLVIDVNPQSGVFATSGYGPIPTGDGTGPDDVSFSPTHDLLAVALGTANTAAFFGVTTTAPPTDVTGSPIVTGTGPTASTFNRQGTLVAFANIYSNDVTVLRSTGPAPAVTRILSSRATIRKGHILVHLGCASIVDGGRGHVCSGQLTLTRDGHRLDRVRIRIQPGRTPTFRLSLPTSAVKLTAHKHRIVLSATATALGATTVSRRMTVSR